MNKVRIHHGSQQRIKTQSPGKIATSLVCGVLSLESQQAKVAHVRSDLQGSALQAQSPEIILEAAHMGMLCLAHKPCCAVDVDRYNSPVLFDGTLP